MTEVGKEARREEMLSSVVQTLSNVVIFAAVSTLLIPLTFPRFYPEGK